VETRELRRLLLALGWPVYLYGEHGRRDLVARDLIETLRVACGAGWGTPRMLEAEMERRRSADRGPIRRNAEARPQPVDDPYDPDNRRIVHLGPFRIHGEYPDGSGRVIPRFDDVPEEKSSARQELGCSMVHRDVALLRLAIAEENGDEEGAERFRRHVEEAQPRISRLFDELEN
jgi:hypothetical protein